MKRFNTFEGVFTPALLSILGVIMYLRLGWVVGQTGLAGALLIIVFANFITFATGLSMSSIVTNIRIGTGGAYSIIAKSLGVEAGGAIGIPLYLSQAISVAFYITGFTECWISVFPFHNVVLVYLIVWLAVTLLSYWSAKLAFRLQYVIMTVIGLSLISVFAGQGHAAVGGAPAPVLWQGNFWKVFAIFFPAVTGVLAGAAMSGELTDPRVSIPRGTLSAIGVSFGIYVAMAFWFSHNASANILSSQTTIIIDLARWKWLVIAGIMGATLSSAINMAVGSPRTLLALAKHSIVPLSSSFARVNKKGEPTPAILFTALLSLLTLLLGTLDSVATLLTMIFLITYGMINIVVFIEQSIGIASFRPAFRIPRVISFLGGLGSFVVMFLINPTFSLVALALIVVIYFVMLRRELEIHSPNVRSGLLIFLAERFARAAAALPYYPKIWKPNLLVPVENLDVFKKVVSLLRAVISPAGRVFCFRIVKRRDVLEGEGRGLSDMRAPNLRDRKKAPREEITTALGPLQEEGMLFESCVVEADDFLSGGLAVMQTVRDTFLPPNTLFYVLPPEEGRDQETLRFVNKAAEEGYGIILLNFDEGAALGQERVVNLWIRQQSPNVDLSILIALQLRKNWDGPLRIIQAVAQAGEIETARSYCERLKEIMRLPADVEVHILVGGFREVLAQAPAADVNIFGMPEVPDLPLIRFACAHVRTSVLFLRDSKHESAMA